MAWTVPGFSRAKVDQAGATLIAERVPPETREKALLVVNNWRAAHGFPLNTFQMGLRGKAKAIYTQSLVEQRVKRLSSIEQKLRRYPALTLSEVQDIGGCRVVLGSVQQVQRLMRSYEKGRFKHNLDDKDDYIVSPKSSGYRSVHLIYRYHSDRNRTYNDLKIELQIRSPLQHAWATAVETVQTFIGQALKSSQGDADWLQFFRLMGTAIALREKSVPVPNTPTTMIGLVPELQVLAKKLEVASRLRAYGQALQFVKPRAVRGEKYFLLALESRDLRITIKGYASRDLERASKDYLETERRFVDTPGSDAVLVSVESLAALKRAYPNYFLDTNRFLDAVVEAVSS